jgi:hypothetical protein
MTQGKWKPLRYIKREYIDIRIIVASQPLQSFFSDWSCSDDIKIFGGGVDVGV